MSILILLLIPAILAAGLYLTNRRSITTGELLIQLAVQSILIFGIYAMVRHYQLQDTEIWNGRVTSKRMERVSCRHAYPCNPHPCMCGKNGCSTCWDICHVHGYDQDWNVYNNLGEDWTIDTVDSQGLKEPPFYTKVQMGDTTASAHSYTNYIKNSAQSLFNRGKATVAYPVYPLSIFNYYSLNRLVDPNGLVPDATQWNADISSMSADLGRTKQVNVVIYVVKDKPLDYYDGLNRAWSGAKKNDVVAVLNVSGSSITWANVISLVKDEYFRVKLRDDLMAVGMLDRGRIMSVIYADIAQYYVRRPMADFKYLLNATKLSTGWFILALVLSVVVSLILSVILASNEWEDYNERDTNSGGGGYSGSGARRRWRGYRHV